MQQKIQMYWNKAKTVLMFTWRHLFTFYITYKIMKVLVNGNIPTFPFTFYILVAAIALDWVKMKLKGGNGDFNTFNHNDPYTLGTFAYFSRRNREQSSTRYY